MKKEKDPVEEFLALSVLLTGFERVDLQGTGMTQEYYNQLVKVVGDQIAEELLAVSDEIIKQFGPNEAKLDAAVRREILASLKLGPVARNIIQMWYLGSWTQLPQEWRNKYGTSPDDINQVISAEAYKQSLVWTAMDAHPQGAKQPGFGSWSQPPAAERF